MVCRQIGSIDLVLTSVCDFNAGLALRYAGKACRGDRAIALVAVQSNGLALEYVSKALKRDWRTVLAASAANVDALQHASKASESHMITYA